MRLVELDNALLKKYKGKQILLIDGRNRQTRVIKGTIVSISIVNEVVVARVDQSGCTDQPIEHALKGEAAWKFMHSTRSFDFSARAHFKNKGYLTIEPSRDGSRAYIQC